MNRQLACLLAVSVITSTAWWGCSPIKENTTSPGDNTNGEVAAGGAGGNGGGQSSGAGGNGGFDPGGDGGLSDADICEEVHAEAENIPLDMIVLLDRSGSMSGTTWSQSVLALNTFFSDPDSAGITVGMSFFPAIIENGDCNPDDYKPLHVPLGELPAYTTTLSSQMAMVNPLGYTPMYGALLGTLTFATARQDAYPDRKVIVVLASDGAPNGCPGNQDALSVVAALAGSAFNYNGVMTYAIAVAAASLPALNMIAAAGGTGAAYDVSININAFAEKMEEIRAKALGCEYLIPDVKDVLFDPTKVNVSHISGGSGTPQQLPKADNLADCGADPGWYYDDPAEPTKIFLCPASCTAISNDPDGKISFAFGCPTVPK